MTILCIIGNSGSGKSTIATEMEKFGIRQIVSYTTRPMRDGEVNGIGHFFISDEMAQHLLMAHRPLAYTMFGGYRYFALFQNISIPYSRHDIVSYVIDEKGFLNLLRNVNRLQHLMRVRYGFVDVDPIHLLPIYVEPTENVSNVDTSRLARDMERIVLPADTYKLRIVNDAADLSALLQWSKDFAEAIRAYLTVVDADTMPSSGKPIYTSQTGVANIIAAINNALHHK